MKNLDKRLGRIENSPLQIAIAETKTLFLATDKCIADCAHLWTDGLMLDMYHGKQPKPQNSPLWERYSDTYTRLRQALKDNRKALTDSDFDSYSNTIKAWLNEYWTVDNEQS